MGLELKFDPEDITANDVLQVYKIFCKAYGQEPNQGDKRYVEANWPREFIRTSEFRLSPVYDKQLIFKRRDYGVMIADVCHAGGSAEKSGQFDTVVKMYFKIKKAHSLDGIKLPDDEIIVS